MEPTDETIYLKTSAKLTHVNSSDMPFVPATITFQYNHPGTQAAKTEDFEVNRHCPIIPKLETDSDGNVINDNTGENWSIAASRKKLLVNALLTQCGQCFLYKTMCQGLQREPKISSE